MTLDTEESVNETLESLYFNKIVLQSFLCIIEQL